MRIGLSAVNLAIDLAPVDAPKRLRPPPRAPERILAMPAESDLSHHRILVTNDDGIHARGLKIPRGDRAGDDGRRLGRRA